MGIFDVTRESMAVSVVLEAVGIVCYGAGGINDGGFDVEKMERLTILSLRLPSVGSVGPLTF